MVWSQHCGSFHHNTPEMSHNCHHNAQINSLTYDLCLSCRNTHHTPAIRPRNCYGYTNRTAVQSEQLTDYNFPCDNLCQQQVHNPNLASNHQVNPLEPVVSKASLLASVMVELPIIHAAISSVEMFDGTKSKFVS